MATLLVMSLNSIVHAGGNPEYVSFPEGYKSDFTQYDIRNRSNGKQVAILYANKIAIDTASDAKFGDGAKIIMEVYKTILGEDGKPMTDDNGLFIKAKFAAVAVMEKRINWDVNFDSTQRAGDWGFAIYKTDGAVKNNKLDCAGCHTPMPDSDFLFSYSSLIDFIK